jgi:hypothetical protein
MRKYSKKKNKKRINKRTRNKRYKRSKRNYRKGGFNGDDDKHIVKCVSEGCVYYPSIIGRQDAVTKLYLNEKLYNKELESYRKFTEVDPGYLYHCRVFANGLLKFGEIETNLGRKATELKSGKDYYYIDIEYAGDTLGDSNPSVFTPEFKNQFLRFLINVLNLRNQSGEYLVHGDPHGGNICYKVSNAGDFLIRYIDITSAIFVPPNEIVRSNTEISFQFSSLIGCVRTVFGFSSGIANNLVALSMSMKEKSYETVVKQFIDILSQGDSPQEPVVEETTPIKKKYKSAEKPRGVARSLFMDNYDSTDIESPSSSIRSSFEDDLPRKIKPLNLFGDENKNIN